MSQQWKPQCHLHLTPWYFALTSFCSAELLCGRGHATDTSPSSSNPGTWNSEAESRSLLTAGSVTKQDFGTKAGNTGSSLASWRENEDKPVGGLLSTSSKHTFLFSFSVHMCILVCVWRPEDNLKTVSFLSCPIPFCV